MGSTMRLLLSLSAVLLLGAPVAAQVRMGTGSDGRVLLHNQGGMAYSGASQALLQPKADLAESIERHAERRGLDPLLVRAVIQVESVD